MLVRARWMAGAAVNPPNPTRSRWLGRRMLVRAPRWRAGAAVNPPNPTRSISVASRGWRGVTRKMRCRSSIRAEDSTRTSPVWCCPVGPLGSSSSQHRRTPEIVL
ncbi:hypothetical protein T484DRAFT_1956932 [Baffinella frigidus]|nr:hypothetical protein T484DRAFT_1956932 [Cryptophyta sp. CCMP2293]